MNVFGILFTLATSALLLRLPRNWAPLPLLLGAAYVTLVQQLEIGPVHFSVTRLLIMVGLVRVMINGERVAGGMKSIDRMMILWAIWDVCTLLFHKSDVFVFRLGLLYDTLGVYYLFRVFIRGLDDIQNVFKMMCILLLPLSATMLVERLQGNNPLALFGFGSEGVLVTKGHFRAAGPFGHPILAGTVGAACLPMALYLWRQNRKVAVVGLVAALCIVFASGSSGPILTGFAMLAGLAVWKIRPHLRTIRWAVVLGIFTLNLAMNEPVYYLIARIDITGGSTGWYRAHLLQYSFEHLEQWWLAGTDSTRGWTLVAINNSSSDITCHYLQMGVWGGLPLMFLFLTVLFSGFAEVGRGLKSHKSAPTKYQFLIWTVGCILFGHAIALMSVSYFDQSFVFLYLALAMVAQANVAVISPAMISRNTPRSSPAISPAI